MHPLITKASKVIGNRLALRDAHVSDAEFIYSIRTDPSKSQFLSQVSSKLEDQTKWLTAYAQKADEAYFIIESRDGKKLGTVRLYDAKGSSFCWGSWIVIDGAPSSVAIESALMVYAYAIDHLGFLSAHFEVIKENESVWRFHERFGAQRVNETADHFQYTITGDRIADSRRRYKKYLPDGIKVQV